MTKNESNPKSITLVIASKNVHKIREMKSILSSIKQLDILSLLDFPNYTPPEEDINSFKENAITKAMHAAEKLNHWVIADDSGLIVPAINNEPGISSARYAGEKATDKDNRKKLLDRMKHLLDNDRAASFECCVALASKEGLQKCSCASCEGHIIDKEKGGDGFGYDPLFVKHEYNKTFAQLSSDVKNRISHRKKALDKILFAIEYIVN